MIEKRVPVIFTVVGVENDTRFLIKHVSYQHKMRVFMISSCPPDNINSDRFETLHKRELCFLSFK